ncbi:hypothetical protein A3I34_01095 [Candidatus Jorgensenbacteria bacterium RIFCSPLOWO2_02_FULL_45_12]|uniref:Tetratricopeptide repeat-like domain-containing protein n=2 Tax=Candidatus Joergenseniibacteriota TaxID=1752739 RepID=A0A1F6BN62_9BACT|nr:MAG: hypothetical protein UX22_C0027G0004 [Candidatus Jorgensenbacteria bacterium GW2011_GWA2_45_9]OGG38364.1 MAG: hypothetical protein A3D55_00345 [Candidatus Jorgensenbacteria bacterium RIFCSPHIGHO2_02_FULL_45_20]OGG42642.1 MAG: hypothetical protein A3I34_01095 [Candidatus Jorgensenbacteria bacterium RIFCSPLOWO2_02_FULL_45_12]
MFFNLKKTIIAAILALSLLSLYFGSYIPWTRSRAFIRGLRGMNKIKSVANFKNLFEPALRRNVIGDEETFKYLAGEILKIISQEDTTENVSLELINFIKPYHSENNVRHLMSMGDMHYILWRKNMNPEYFNQAEQFYLKAKEAGPKLPPPLYMLLTLYQNGFETEKAKDIARYILSLWPDDQKVQAFIDSK